MQFHLIDRIDAWEASTSARAVKLMSATETFWQEGPDGPRMPRSLVLESLCQTATWLIMLSTDTRKRAALLSIGGVEWADDVRPGERLDLEVTVASMSEEMGVVSGTASVDGRTVMTAEDLMCALIDAGDLEDVEDTRRMQERIDRSSQ